MSIQKRELFKMQKTFSGHTIVFHSRLLALCLPSLNFYRLSLLKNVVCATPPMLSIDDC
jgi:hypothetical protein